VFHEKAAQAGASGQAFNDFEQAGFQIGARRVSRAARMGGITVRLRDDGPVKEGKEGAVALHNGIMGKHLSERWLVKDAGVWYHTSKLLAG
jgi:hypothetical protein